MLARSFVFVVVPPLIIHDGRSRFARGARSGHFEILPLDATTIVDYRQGDPFGRLGSYAARWDGGLLQ